MWGAAMVTSKHVGLRMLQKIDDYPMLNRLIRIGINDDEGSLFVFASVD